MKSYTVGETRPLTYRLKETAYRSLQSRVRCPDLNPRRLKEGKRVTKLLFGNKKDALVAAVILRFKWGWPAVSPYLCRICKKDGEPGWHLFTLISSVTPLQAA